MSTGDPKGRSNGTMLALASPSFSAVLLALLPKCPACMMLLLAPLGIRWHLPYEAAVGAAVVAFAIPLVMLRTERCGRCAVRPCCLALFGAAIMATGRLAGGGPVLLVAGAAIVCSALLWTARLSLNRAHRRI